MENFESYKMVLLIQRKEALIKLSDIYRDNIRSEDKGIYNPIINIYTNGFEIGLISKDVISFKETYKVDENEDLGFLILNHTFSDGMEELMDYFIERIKLF